MLMGRKSNISYFGFPFINKTSTILTLDKAQKVFRKKGKLKENIFAEKKQY